MTSEEPLSIEKFFLEKTGNFYVYVTTTFTDPKYTTLLQDFHKYLNQTLVNNIILYIYTVIKPQTPHVWLTNLLTCHKLTHADFTIEEYEKILRYLNCFVDIVS